MADNKLVIPPIAEVPWYETSQPSLADVEEQQIVNKGVASLMSMKSALVETMASRGWYFVERIAEAVVRDLEKTALEEDDDLKAAGLRRDARGARKFKDDLFKRINMARNFDNKDSFVEVVTD